MKNLFLLSVFLLAVQVLVAQEQAVTEQQLEQFAAGQETETEDDAAIQVLQDYLRRPLNLNTVTYEELQVFSFLTPLQCSRFFQYRMLAGQLISIYELQAVPGWNLETIRHLLPYVCVKEVVSVQTEFIKRFRQGEHSVLIRSGMVAEPSVGFLNKLDSGSNAYYAGSRAKIMTRYKYRYGNILQYGVTAEKDPGEQWFKGSQRSGFDFYSFHVFLRQFKSIHSLAIGDYTVNMGQGLIQWQALAFGKSADVLQIKRQSPVIRPYNSSGEYLFNRGAAITLQKKRFEFSCFYSARQLDGNVRYDSILNKDFITSIVTAGYHRTPGEQLDRKQVRLKSGGAVCRYRHQRFSVAANAMYLQFGKIYNQSPEPYNVYGFRGKAFLNVSLDWSYTFRNMHWFGECASHRGRYYGMLTGLLLSVATSTDLSLVCRTLQPGYQTFNGNAFTERTQPSNEQGIFVGMVHRLHPSVKLEAYADFFRFPWLRYGVHTPSAGSEYVFQLTHKPTRNTELYLRCKRERKQQNATSETGQPIPFTGDILRNSIRLHLQHKLNQNFSIRHRLEVLRHQTERKQIENGFLTFLDLFYKSDKKPLSVNSRISYFDTDSYATAIYAFENDLLYSFSIPAIYHRGVKYYFNFNYHFGKKIQVNLRWSQLHLLNQNAVGSGLDLIQKPIRSEFRGQFFVCLG